LRGACDEAIQNENYELKIKRKIIMNKKILFTALLLSATFFSLPVKAQVTIGDEKIPEAFSLLELVTTNHKGGLRLPQLTTAERDALDLASNPEDAEGLLIYNTDNNCIEYWNHSKWVSDSKAPAPAPVAPADSLTTSPPAPLGKTPPPTPPPTGGEADADVLCGAQTENKLEIGASLEELRITNYELGIK
jgi:hypothetical protein